MPKLITSMIALVVGYLDGAGLGAASYDMITGFRPDNELKIALVAALVTGPIGALLGVVVAASSPSGAGLSTESLEAERS